MRHRIADILDHITDDIGDLDVGFGRNFTGHEGDTSRQDRFAGDPGKLVLGNNGIKIPSEI